MTAPPSARRPDLIRIGVFVATSCVMFALERFAGRWWSFVVLPLLVPALLGGAHRRSADASARAASDGLIAAVILVFGAAGVQILLRNIGHPPEWDFPFFWLNARVATQGLNFYEPDHVLRLADATFAASESFKRQLPFKYPPPTMLLFLPFGALPLKTGLAFWYVLQIIALGLDVVLLRRLFVKEAGWLGLALSVALVLVHRPVLVTLTVAQTNFVVLLMVLLYWQDRASARGGVWLALGAVVKPLLLLVLLRPLARRQWRTLAAAAATLAVASGLSLVAFGPRTFAAYFTRDPTLGVPSSLYTEAVNQSLLAVVLRLSGWTPGGTAPVFHPIFVTVGLLLAAITVGIVWRSDDPADEWSVALTIVLALLLYPGTLLHYAVLLIAPMLLIWERRAEVVTSWCSPGYPVTGDAGRSRLSSGDWGVLAFVTAQYALAYRFTFAATALTWLLLAGVSARRRARG
jgi:hypothetical protein